MKRIAIAAAVVVLTALLAAQAPSPREPSADRPAAPTGRSSYKPVARIQDLMKINQEYNRELREGLTGKTDWDKAVHLANVMAEIGNVLPYYKNTREPVWQDSANLLKDLSLEIAKAAEKKERDKARDLFSKIGKACADCHTEYRKTKAVDKGS